MAAYSPRWTAEWTYSEDALDASVTASWPDAPSASHSHVFHRADVLNAWRETIGAAGGLAPAVGRFVRDDGAVVQLACVVSRQSGRLLSRRVLEPMGQDLFGYHDPWIQHDRSLPPIDWDAFWTAVRATAPGGTDQALFRFVHAGFTGSRFMAGTDASPVLHLTGCRTLDEVLARCSANHRGDVRRRVRRLSERGAVELQVFSSGARDAARADFADRYWPVWTSTPAGTALQGRPGFRDYCDRVIGDGIAAGWAHYAVLTVAGEPVAWHLGLADRGRLYWWIPVHAPEWDAYSPGKVLLAVLIERMLEGGWTELHFQTGSQPYKMAWKPDTPPLAAVRWHAPHLRARVISTYDRMAAR